MTKAEIVAMLQEGTSVDDIAGEMAKMLNEAEKEYNEIQEAEKEKEQTEGAKIAAVTRIAEGICDYLVATGNEDLYKEFMELEIEKLVEIIDNIVNMSAELMKLKDLGFQLLV